MKVKVIAKFRDKVSSRILKKNDILDITKERYEEILKVGDFVEIIPETEQTEAEVKKPGRKKKADKGE